MGLVLLMEEGEIGGTCLHAFDANIGSFLQSLLQNCILRQPMKSHPEVLGSKAVWATAERLRDREGLSPVRRCRTFHELSSNFWPQDFCFLFFFSRKHVEQGKSNSSWDMNHILILTGHDLEQILYLPGTSASSFAK